MAISAVFLLLRTLPAAALTPDGETGTGNIQGNPEQILVLIRTWVAGRYDNSAQAAQDLAFVLQRARVRNAQPGLKESDDHGAEAVTVS